MKTSKGSVELTFKLNKINLKKNNDCGLAVKQC